MPEHVYTYLIRISTDPQPSPVMSAEMIVRAETLQDAVNYYLNILPLNTEVKRIDARKVNGNLIESSWDKANGR